jgi:dGTPase
MIKMKLSEDTIKRIKTNLNLKEHSSLRLNAQLNSEAKRRELEKDDYRSRFIRDSDRIIHSLSYARYFDKTQVFFWIESDLHQRRMHHVQLVAKTGREIGRALGLNEDLIESIALGHDIGHVPFGHDGETILNELTMENGIGRFFHNYESVWFLQEIEHQNLTLPTIDGILCHNGESHHRLLEPQFDKLSWEQHDLDMKNLISGKNLDPTPKTIEGCLVRFVDTISYISRDIRDAEYLGFTSFEELPSLIKERLGSSNREIINSLVSDLIMNSIDQDYIAYSEETYEALEEMYKFNYDNIYNHPEKLHPIPQIRKAFKLLWDHYYEDLIENDEKSKIYLDHLELNLKEIQFRYPHIDDFDKYTYAQKDPKIIVRDFIAGMTDVFFWKLAKELDDSLVLETKQVY